MGNLNSNWLIKDISKEDLDIEKTLAVIGATIRTERLNRHMTQTEFGKIFNVTHQMISKWESGTFNFKVSTLIKIYYRLGLKFELY